MAVELLKKAILIVDDDEAEVELISMAIEDLKLPHPIHVARNGLAALDYLNRRGKFADRPPGMPLLVILDNKMPMMSGIEALREIGRDNAFRGMPIVMFSASAHERDVTDAYAAGVTSYVVKPTSATNFRDVVHMIVNYWIRTNTAGSVMGP